MNQNPNTQKNLPEQKFRASPISATIWNNSGVNQKGEPHQYSTISFERTYKDKEGHWKTTNHLRVTDIPKAVLVLTKAFEHLTLSQQASEEAA